MNFQVGDLVAFKTWDQMKDEFGTYMSGTEQCIRCRFSFTPTMNRIIPDGYQFRITSISSGGDIYGHGFDYSISSDMLYLVDAVDNYAEYDDSEIEKFLHTIKVI